jgi:hypothetical protein
MADPAAAPPETNLPAAVPSPSGHKTGFVQPSSYLRQQSDRRSMTSKSEKQTDKDEKLALVSNPTSFSLIPHAHLYSSMPLVTLLLASNPRIHKLTYFFSHAAGNPQLSESPHKLRCPTPELPINHFRYRLDC